MSFALIGPALIRIAVGMAGTYPHHMFCITCTRLYHSSCVICHLMKQSCSNANHHCVKIVVIKLFSLRLISVRQGFNIFWSSSRPSTGACRNTNQLVTSRLCVFTFPLVRSQRRRHHTMALRRCCTLYSMYTVVCWLSLVDSVAMFVPLLVGLLREPKAAWWEKTHPRVFVHLRVCLCKAVS